MRAFILCYILLLSICFFCSCRNEGNSKDLLHIDQLKWMVGKWQLEGKEVFEVWKHEEQKIKGLSFVVTNEDTMVLEYLSIEMIGDTLFYIPTVLNQNDGKPIPFKSESNQTRKLSFVNMSHDFPQVIKYDLIGMDTIKVTLKGTLERKNEFLLLRHE